MPTRKPAKKKAQVTDTAAMERRARALLVASIAALEEEMPLVNERLTKALKNPKLDTKLIRDLAVVQGIHVDKIRDLVKGIHDLEAATTEELEAVFTIVMVHPRTGEETVVQRDPPPDEAP